MILSQRTDMWLPWSWDYLVRVTFKYEFHVLSCLDSSTFLPASSLHPYPLPCVPKPLLLHSYPALYPAGFFHPLHLSWNITFSESLSLTSLLRFSFLPPGLFPSRKWSQVEIISCWLSFRLKCTHPECWNHIWLLHCVSSSMLPRR